MPKLEVRVTDAERDALRRVAEARGLTVSNHVRRVLGFEQRKGFKGLKAEARAGAAARLSRSRKTPPRVQTPLPAWEPDPDELARRVREYARTMPRATAERMVRSEMRREAGQRGEL